MAFDADVVIIGAGIAGAGIAAELSQDRMVLLLEQEDHPGIHATGRSAALHSEVYGNDVIRILTQASRADALRGADGVPFARPRGCLHVATQSQLERLHAFAGQPNVADTTDWIAGPGLRDCVPVLHPGRIVAALKERNAYDLDVDAIHRHFLRRLRARSGVLRCANQVRAIARHGERWRVTTSAGDYHAPVVVNAGGAWGDRIAAMAGVPGVGLQPRRRSALIVDPPEGVDPSAWPAVIDIDEQFYFKPEAGKILMSPADETPSPPCDAYPDDYDLALAVERVQQVADIPVRRIQHRWAGLRTFVADARPVVGFDPDHPGFFWLVGQGGYGIQTAPALSRLAASLLRGRGVPADLADRGLTAADLAPRRFGSGPDIGTRTPGDIAISGAGAPARQMEEPGRG